MERVAEAARAQTAAADVQLQRLDIKKLIKRDIDRERLWKKERERKILSVSDCARKKEEERERERERKKKVERERWRMRERASERDRE